MNFIDTYRDVNYFLDNDFGTVRLLHITDCMGSIDSRYVVFYKIKSLYKTIYTRGLELPFIIDDCRLSNLNVIHLGLFDLNNNVVCKKDLHRIMYKLRLLCDKNNVTMLAMYRPEFLTEEFGYSDFKRALTQSFSDSNVTIVCCARKEI